MSLPPPAPRRHQHTRTIVCEGFRRDDGLWDIEARIIDTKSYAYTEPVRGARDAGSPVHDMAVRLTLDGEMVVRDIAVAMQSTPYPACLGAPAGFKGLIGKTVGAGWRRAVQDCVGGVKGCTHVRELLGPMATVAFQTINGWREGEDANDMSKEAATGQKPLFVDGCMAWASDGDIVARFYPQFAIRRAQ